MKRKQSLPFTSTGSSDISISVNCELRVILKGGRVGRKKLLVWFEIFGFHRISDVLLMNVCLTSFCWTAGQGINHEGYYSSPESYRLIVSGLIAFSNSDNWLLIDFCACPD